MDKKIIFVRTSKGEDEFKSKTSHLSGDFKRVLGLVDDKSTVEELTKRAAPSLRASFDDMLQELANGRFIQDKEGSVKVVTPQATPKMATPKMAMPGARPKDSGDELDFTTVRPKLSKEALAAEEAKAKTKAQMAMQEQASRAKFESEEKARAETDAKARQEAEARARAEAETFRLKAEQESAKVMTELAAAQARAKEEAEAKARAEAETARLKAEQEAEKARAELAAAQARAKEEAEARARAEAEAARIKAEQEAEAARIRAEQEAEAARIKAEQEAEKAQAELAAAQARAKEEAEARARAEAEAARLKAEQEAEKARAELAAAQARAKEEAEAKARAEAEAARLKAEQEAENARAELAAAQARAKEEAEARARAEAETARLKAEQEAEKARAELAAAQAGEKEEAEARARAEAETARLKEEQEEAKLLAELAAVQAKEKAEAEAKTHAEAAAKISSPTGVEPHAQIPEDSALKARSDEEARQLAESQARIWAEAEQRARMQAQQADAMQQIAQQAEKITPAKAVPRVAKEPREPLPWGKISAGLLGLSVVLVVLLPYVWPMQDYIAQIEQRLSAQLKQPVHIGHMRPSLLPLPKLELQNVSVGSGQEMKAGSIVLNFDVVALFTDTRLIGRAEIGDLTLRAESFDKALSWIQAAGGDANYPVAHLVLQRVRVSGTELNLPVVNGVVDFDGQGRLAKAVLNSEDGKLSVELQPQPQQPRWQIALVIKENNLPLVPGIMFDELNAKGEAGAGEVNFSVIEGQLYKGKLLGNARLTWKNGWQVQGQLSVKTLALQDALPQSGITGELDGNASFILRGAQLPLLAQSPHLDGRFSIKKGFISSIDMVETARVSNRQGASAGRTHFDELNGTLVVDGNSLQLRQIKISAGVMSANGFVDVVSGEKLSGRMNVDLKMRAEMGSMPLTLSGTLTEPVWRTGR